MATKQNMYVRKKEQAVSLLEEINKCVVAWRINEVGVYEVAVYFRDSAETIRNKAANMQGQLEVLLSGLDMNSRKRKDYQYLLEMINQFLIIFS